MLVELQAPDLPQREQLLQRLSGEARDLGKPGRDDVYGAGELDGQL
jgi:hypothetical protein